MKLIANVEWGEMAVQGASLHVHNYYLHAPSRPVLLCALSFVTKSIYDIIDACNVNMYTPNWVSCSHEISDALHNRNKQWRQTFRMKNCLRRKKVITHIVGSGWGDFERSPLRAKHEALVAAKEQMELW